LPTNPIQAEVLARLKNARGHIAGIEKMVEEGKSCENILIQLSAVRAAIEKIGIHILENHAAECLSKDGTSEAEKEKLEQVVKQILSFLK